MSDDMLSALNQPNPNIASVLALPDGGYGLTLAAIEQSFAETPDDAWLIPMIKSLAAKQKFGYVYIIEGTHEGVTKHKIGKANNLRDRVRTFNVKLPFDIRVVASFYVFNPLEFEGHLHGLMSANRLAGEWFDLTAAEIYDLCLLGMSKETSDLARIMEAALTDANKGAQMSDAEYIDYLESMLVIRNIRFSRELKNHGAHIETDRGAVDSD